MTPKEQELIELARWMDNPTVMTGLILLAIWTLAWKGTALWKAAKNNSAPWFVALIILNTVGILEIIYIFFFSNKKSQE